MRDTTRMTAFEKALQKAIQAPDYTISLNLWEYGLASNCRVLVNAIIRIMPLTIVKAVRGIEVLFDYSDIPFISV